ncbi:hypothetical protein BJY00DRAFT_318602 [Aspergillus carlsbadensis]|nr:hypothetical protein BJY00DRAFT_318602 [Aspergillus carlsbadensis]
MKGLKELIGTRPYAFQDTSDSELQEDLIDFCEILRGRDPGVTQTTKYESEDDQPEELDRRGGGAEKLESTQTNNESSANALLCLFDDIVDIIDRLYRLAAKSGSKPESKANSGREGADLEPGLRAFVWRIARANAYRQQQFIFWRQRERDRRNVVREPALSPEAPMERPDAKNIHPPALMTPAIQAPVSSEVSSQTWKLAKNTNLLDSTAGARLGQGQSLLRLKPYTSPAAPK